MIKRQTLMSRVNKYWKGRTEKTLRDRVLDNVNEDQDEDEDEDEEEEVITYQHKARCHHCATQGHHQR
jgi:hypothetical protein